MTVLEVEHETLYGYAAPVTQAQHLAYLKPLQDARQQLLQHELSIEPTPLQLLHDPQVSLTGFSVFRFFFFGGGAFPLQNSLLLHFFEE